MTINSFHVYVSLTSSVNQLFTSFAKFSPGVFVFLSLTSKSERLIFGMNSSKFFEMWKIERYKQGNNRC